MGGEETGQEVVGLLPQGYGAWLAGLKQELLRARQRAAFLVHAELIGLHHRMGHFAQACPDGQSVQQPAAQSSWFHVVTPLSTQGRAHLAAGPGPATPQQQGGPPA